MNRLGARFADWTRSESARLGGVLCALTALALATGVFARWDWLIYDTALRAARSPAPRDIVIVAIDERSLEQLGRWPWSRDLHARMIERLTQAGARAIGYDVTFAEPAGGDDGDRHLAGAIAADGNVVLPVFPASGENGALREVQPLRAFANVAAKLGHVDTEVDRDGLVRSVYLRAGLASPVWPTFALAMLEQAEAADWQPLPGETRPAGVPASAPRWQRDHRVLVNFGGPPGRIRQISFADVLDLPSQSTALRGKFVLVGVTAAGIDAGVATPVSGENRPLSGVEFNATVLDNLRNGSWITVAGMPLHVTVLSLFALLPALLYPRLAPRHGLMCAALLLVMTVALPVLLMLYARLWLAPAPAVFAVALSYPLWSWRRIERAADHLKRERELARATLHAIGDAVVTTDVDGVITYMNPVAEHLSEHSRRHAVGRHIGSVFWSAQQVERDKAAQAIAQAVAENRPVRSPSYALLNKRLGDAYAVRITASPIDATDGTREGVVLALHDVTENLSLSAQVAHQATHDSLTALPNRELLRDRVQQALAAARRDESLAAVLFLDLDGFKYVNSSYDHAHGDALLVEIGERLQDAARAHDTVARWDGDQFGILASGLERADQAGELAQRLLEAVREPCNVAGHEIRITASIGISLYPRDGVDADSLFHHADTALHRVKQRERNGIGYFDESHDARARERLRLATALHRALEEREFVLHYQPTLGLAGGQVVGVEALLRWQHPERGLLLPGEYVPVAEESDLIQAIGAWVLQEACRQARRWQDAGLNLQVAVNVSARQLADDALLGTVENALRASGADPRALVLEITESAVMHERDHATGMLHALKKLGLSIAIDDFGTGFASLANLKQLPFDLVKIDQSFIRDLERDPGDAAITRAVIGMAHSMRLTVIAEGVETESQLDFLRAHACDEIQGYWLSPALPAAELNDWMAARARSGAAAVSDVAVQPSRLH